MVDESPNEKVQRLSEEADSLIRQGYFAEAFKRYLNIWEDCNHSFDEELGKKFSACLSKTGLSLLTLHGRSIRSLVENSRYLRNDAETRRMVKLILQECSAEKGGLDLPKKEVKKILSKARSLYRRQDYSRALEEYMRIWEEYRLSFDAKASKEILACASKLGRESLSKHAPGLRSLLESHPHPPDDPETKQMIQKVSQELHTEEGKRNASPKNRQGCKYSILLAKLYQEKGDHQNERAQWEKLILRTGELSDQDRNLVYESLTRIYLRRGLPELEEKQVKFLCERLPGGEATPALRKEIETRIRQKIESLSDADQKIHLARNAWSWCKEDNGELVSVYANEFRERNQKERQEIQIIKKAIFWHEEDKPGESPAQKGAKKLKEYLAAIYQANQMVEQAKDTMERLRSEYPNDQGIKRKLREVNCELSKKLVSEGKRFILDPAAEQVV